MKESTKELYIDKRVESIVFILQQPVYTWGRGKITFHKDPEKNLDLVAFLKIEALARLMYIEICRLEHRNLSSHITDSKQIEKINNMFDKFHIFNDSITTITEEL